MHKSSPFPRLLMLALVAAVPSACTPPASSGPSPSLSDGEVREARGRSDVITQEQMAELSSLNLYQLIERLRPQWLRRSARSLSGADEVVVFQDASYLGGPEVLRQLHPGLARRLRYLDAATASATLAGLGSRKVLGAIVIETR
jgi:hypothetical protein